MMELIVPPVLEVIRRKPPHVD